MMQLLKGRRDHWAHTEVAALRLQCSVRVMMAKLKLARKQIIDGLRILFDVLEEIVAVSMDNAELQIRRIINATSIQACWRGRKGRLKARDRVSKRNCMLRSILFHFFSTIRRARIYQIVSSWLHHRSWMESLEMPS